MPKITRRSNPPVADYDAQSAVERELVLRLASLLWRLRRATTMETGLFEIQADHLREFRQVRQVGTDSPGTDAPGIVDTMFQRVHPVGCDRSQDAYPITNGMHPVRAAPEPDDQADLARCFLRLANLHSCALDRLSRYEAILWRQAGQILFALDALDRRKPQDRGRRFRVAHRGPLPTEDPEDY